MNTSPVTCSECDYSVSCVCGIGGVRVCSNCGATWPGEPRRPAFAIEALGQRVECVPDVTPRGAPRSGSIVALNVEGCALVEWRLGGIAPEWHALADLVLVEGA